MKIITVGNSKEEAIAIANTVKNHVEEAVDTRPRFAAALLAAVGISWLINRASEQRRKRDPWMKFVRDAHDDRNYRDDR